MTGTQNLTIRGNHFERLTGDAIQMDGTGVLIEGNTFDHIQVRPGCSAHTDVIQSLGAEDVTIRGNVARDNDSGILNSSADHQTRGWTIENNVFARSSGTPLQLDNQMDDLVVANNTFTASGVGVLFRWWTNPGVPVNSQGFVIANNVFGNGYSIDPKLNIAFADYNLTKPGAHRYGAHDIAADPRFVDPAANGFDLRADSPAVDSGTSGAVATIRGAAYSLPATDLVGGARTGVHDRGAYELGATPADPPPVADPTPAPDPAPAPEPPAAPDPTPDPAAPADPAPRTANAEAEAQPTVRGRARSGPAPPRRRHRPARRPPGVVRPPARRAARVRHPPRRGRPRAVPRRGNRATAAVRPLLARPRRDGDRQRRDGRHPIARVGRTTVAGRRGANTVAFAAGAGRRGPAPAATA